MLSIKVDHNSFRSRTQTPNSEQENEIFIVLRKSESESRTVIDSVKHKRNCSFLHDAIIIAVEQSDYLAKYITHVVETFICLHVTWSSLSTSVQSLKLPFSLLSIFFLQIVIMCAI